MQEQCNHTYSGAIILDCAQKNIHFVSTIIPEVEHLVSLLDFHYQQFDPAVLHFFPSSHYYASFKIGYKIRVFN